MNGASAEAVIWTLAAGDTVDGEFIAYDADKEVVTIRRSNERDVFEIAEKHLTPADLRKAIDFQMEKEKPYWFHDYEKRMMRKKRKRFVLFFNNGASPEEFSLFCDKLLLRSDMKDFFKERRITVFVQNSIPVDWGIRYTPWQNSNLAIEFRGDPALAFYTRSE